MKMLIIYHTKTGHTLEAIKPFSDVAKSLGVQVDIVLAKKFKPETIAQYDAFVVGTPCWGGSSGMTGVATPIIKVLKKLPENSLIDKLCGGIAVHAKYGGAATLSHLEKLMEKKGCTELKKAPIAKAGVLTSIVKGKSVSKADEDVLREFGQEFIRQLSK